MAAEFGRRIREARQRAGLTQDVVARKAEMDVTALSKIETGRRSVKVDELQSIASAIGVAAGDLLQGHDAPTPGRGRGFSPGPLQGRGARERLAWLAKLHDQLQEAGIRAPVRPAGATQSVPVQATAVEPLATWAREQVGAATTGVGDLESLVNAIEAGLMIDVMVDPDPGPSLGGALGGPDFAAIYVNSAQATDGALFTLAHELGHVLVESAIPLTDDADFDSVTPKERAANAFAASFLLPADELKPILDEHDLSPAALAVMMLRFGVGWDVLVGRLHRLGYIERPDRGWLAKLDRRALAESVRDAGHRAALLSKSGAPCGLHHAPRWVTTRAWIGARRGAIPIDVYAALIGEQPSGVVLPRHTIANTETKPGVRAPRSTS